MERFLERLRKIDPVWVLCLLAVIGLAVMFITRYMIVRDSRGSAAALELLVPPGEAGIVRGDPVQPQPQSSPRMPSPSPTPAPTLNPDETIVVVHSVNSRVFHIDPNCHSVRSINEANRREREASVNELLEDGFRPCNNCARGVGG
jgi:hypothetical protein